MYSQTCPSSLFVKSWIFLCKPKMYEILVAHVWNSKLTPWAFLCPKELVKTMRSIPLFCQIDERDVHKEGNPWLLPVLRRGGETQDSRGELRWSGLYAPPRYLTDRGGGRLTANVPPDTRTVVPVLVEIIPATWLADHRLEADPARHECQRLKFTTKLEEEPKS